MNLDPLSFFDGKRLLVVGDLMVDEYLWGKVERISPEAPVPVVGVDKEESTLGGAGNVIRNLRTLGAEVMAVGIAGKDPASDALFGMLDELKVEAGGVLRVRERSTTRKTRVMAGTRLVARIDRETASPISQETAQTLARAAAQRMDKADAILISDYNKGVLTPYFMAALKKEAARKGVKTLADPKGLDFSKYGGVDLITPNKKEACLAAGIMPNEKKALGHAAKILREKWGLARLLITCGKDGMALFEPDQDPVFIRARARQVFDVSGAGDTVLAVMGLCAACGFSYAQSADVANTAAGIVVEKVGTASVSRAELALALAPKANGLSRKWVSKDDLAPLCDSLRQGKKRIVLTNGCFDLLHVGHVLLLSRSRRMGDVLIVAVDDDASVAHFKGQGRPVLPQNERLRMLAALEAVDYVTLFFHDELEQIIDAVKPHVLTKGANYAPDQVACAHRVIQHGGIVQRIPVVENVSSTHLIRDIRSSFHPD